MKWMQRWLFAALSLAALVSCASARDIIDMVGRHVALPEKIEKIYSTSPPTTLVVYAMRPETLLGWSAGPRLLSKEEKDKFLEVHTRNLPTIGNMMGHGQQANVEEILAMKPDLVIAWTNAFIDAGILTKRFADAKIPLVFLKLEVLDDYAKAFDLMGEIFNDQPRAALLSGYIKDALSKVRSAVATIPEDQRVKVYYAVSPDGLATSCDRSLHAEALWQAGGVNVDHCEQQDLMGLEQVSLEQVVQFKPDIIISQSREFAHMVGHDSRWRNVKAVHDGNVKDVPTLPFNWIDRPPSYMQALGIQWLANLFYPKAYPLDLKSETKHFYKLFLNVDLSDQDVDHILN